jgi:glycerol kinase
VSTPLHEQKPCGPPGMLRPRSPPRAPDSRRRPGSTPGEAAISILVIDVGTSSVRASIVHPDGRVEPGERRATPPSVPFPGLVEFDADAMAAAALDTARAALAGNGPVDAVGIATQRASTVAWDASTGRALGPGIGWQDLRTAGTCLELQSEGIRLSPSESAVKYAWLLDQYDAARGPGTRLGTVDAWIVWHLSGGDLHVTDPGNAGTTGLLRDDASAWRTDLLDRLRIPPGSLPRLVASSGVIGAASALDGAPPICGLAGDQQASLIGQGCTRPGLAKATFGTGAMLDVCVGARPTFPTRGEAGCFPIVAWARNGTTTWGVEAIMLAAGSTVDWLVEDLGVLSSAAESAAVAAGCDDTGGVVMVPALSGLGTPQWDFGARGALLGLTRGSGRAQLVRAVLEGVAQRGADLLEAAETDAGTTVATLRVDGGMSGNKVFVQALADACGRPVELSPQLEATTLGAGYLAGLAVGTWADEDEIADAWAPRATIEPHGTPDRDRWRSSVQRAREWYPELTAVQF